jgi:hypothetical protein
VRELVADELTPLTLDEAIEAFAKAYFRCMGSEVRAGTLACLVAQSALESGNWKHMHGYNFGNIKASPDWDGLFMMFRCNEVIGGNVVWFDPPHFQTHFRAYATAAEGAQEQIKFHLRERYKGSWHHAYLGDAHAFAMTLGEEGYYTADRVSYSKAVASIAARILPACASYLAGEGHAITLDDAEYVAALVYRTLDEHRGTDPAPPPIEHDDLAPETPRV